MVFFIIFNITPILWKAISWWWALNTSLTVHIYTHFQKVAIAKSKKWIQYCAKVTQRNLDDFPGFSWLFEEISLQMKFLWGTIVLVCLNYERCFIAGANELQIQEGNVALLESPVQNFESKFTLVITVKCSPRFLVMQCRNIQISFIRSINYSIAPSCRKLNEYLIVDVIRTAKCRSLSTNDYAHTPGKWNLDWAPFLLLARGSLT